MPAAYAGAPVPAAAAYSDWTEYSTQPYQSATHGSRYVRNFGNDAAAAYGRYEEAGVMPVGAVLAKDSFAVAPSGKVSIGPLFLMEKMSSGFLERSGDWKYTMVMPDGSIFGETQGRNAEKVEFCIGCHQAAAEYDHLWFLPAEYRVNR